MTWFLIQTKPNAELYAEHCLRAPYRAVITYFPKMRVRRAHAGQVDYVERPFIARYGFIYLEARRSLQVVKTSPGVACVMQSASSKEVAQAVDQIKAREVNGLVDDELLIEHLDVNSFQPNEALRVVSGPFAQFNGIFSRYMSSERRAEVFVSIFGRVSKVVLGVEQLERL